MMTTAFMVFYVGLCMYMRELIVLSIFAYHDEEICQSAYSFWVHRETLHNPIIYYFEEFFEGGGIIADFIHYSTHKPIFSVGNIVNYHFQGFQHFISRLPLQG